MVQEQPNVEATQQKQASAKSLWKEVKPFEWIIIIIVLGYFVYLNNATGLVINVNDGNETRIINGIPNPPNTILYEPNDYVPKSNVSNTQTGIGIFLTIILILVLLAKRISIPKRATIEEAIEDIADHLIKLKNLKNTKITQTREGLKIISDFEEINLSYSFLTRYKTIGDRSWAFRYTIHGVIYNKRSNIQDYYKFFYHPWSRYYDGMLKVAKELADEDRCPKCGSEYDEKPIIGADLMKFKVAKQWVGEKT